MDKIKIQCRACMTLTAREYIDMQSIFTDELSYYDVFAFVTQLNVKSGDGSVTMLCQNCANNVKNIYTFLTEAHYSDIEFRGKMESEGKSENKQTKWFMNEFRKKSAEKEGAENSVNIVEARATSSRLDLGNICEEMLCEDAFLSKVTPTKGDYSLPKKLNK
ncbi:uncharacterized protein LOC119662396 [Teleopsis dalmanni]|uniref:uncharacterized protein LOC119662396 n=1 Tax=Teleopsis dalmanni TaxID=139649 RepID=UPI0018CDE657|nr:uncharacterized protein LOC119662396 [Teleopsis dalmanni]